MSFDEENEGPNSRPSWRFRIAVAAVFLLGIVFAGLSFILIMDPHWAYQMLVPVK